MLILLGGYDLEMITIKELLLRNGFSETDAPVNLPPGNFLADRKLAWGAKLSAYSSFFSVGDHFNLKLTETRS